MTISAIFLNKHLLITSVFLYSLISAPISIAASCYQNHFQSGTFENGNYPPNYVLSEGESLPGGWYNASGTVDIVGPDYTNYAGQSMSAINGSKWIQLAGQDYNQETLGVPLAFDMIAGTEYTIRLWAHGKTTNLKIYLSEATGILNGNDTSSFYKVVDVEIKKKSWEEHEFSFTSPISAKQVLFKNHGNPLQLDDIRLATEGGICRPKLCTSSSNNLIKHSGFESDGPYGGWGSIQRDIDNRLVNAQTANNHFIEETVNPMPNVHSTNNNNKHWMVLHSLQRPGLCFWCNSYPEGNGAITAPLTQATVPGQTYRLSFMGASKNPLTRSPAHININLSNHSYCSTPPCNTDTNDWAEEITGDQTILDSFKLDQKANEWHLYHHDFIANSELKYVLIQAQKGVEPALDDICITSEPFRKKLDKTKLFYSTYNSVRHVNTDKATTTIKSSSSFDLFGLSFMNEKLILSDGSAGINGIRPLYTSPAENQITQLIQRSLATDFDFNDANAYIAANYKIYKANNFLSNTTNAISEMHDINSVQAPFSLASSGHYLFVAGQNQISLTNLISGQTSLISNHGVSMFGFLDMGEDGRLYIADPASDSVRVLTTPQVSSLKTSLDNNTPLNVGTFTTLSQGALLDDQMNGVQDHEIRGPIGVDYLNGILWVTVDTGTNKNGRIIMIDSQNGTQTSYLDNIPGPRDLVVLQ